jgi:hypothetical protein
MHIVYNSFLHNGLDALHEPMMVIVHLTEPQIICRHTFLSNLAPPIPTITNLNCPNYLAIPNIHLINTFISNPHSITPPRRHIFSNDPLHATHHQRRSSSPHYT